MAPSLPEDPVELGIWVLDHGLPPLPRELDIDETIAIARWAGDEYGAVLFVSWYVDDEHGESGVDTDVQTYRRVDGTWTASAGSGGGGWFDEPLKRPDIPAEHAVVGQFHSTQEQSWSYSAAYGYAGRAATLVEVRTIAGSTRAPLDSPVGAFVVAADGSADAFVRVLAADGRVLTEERFAPTPNWIR